MAVAVSVALRQSTRNTALPCNAYCVCTLSARYRSLVRNLRLSGTDYPAAPIQEQRCLLRPLLLERSVASSAVLTTLLGIVGAFVATYLGQAIGWDQADEGAGFVGAVIDDPGRRGDVGTRDHAGAAARGIAKAKAAGKYKGRPVSIDAAQIKQLKAELRLAGSRSVSASPGVRSIARSDRLWRSGCHGGIRRTRSRRIVRSRRCGAVRALR